MVYCNPLKFPNLGVTAQIYMSKIYKTCNMSNKFLKFNITGFIFYLFRYSVQILLLISSTLNFTMFLTTVTNMCEVLIPTDKTLLIIVCICKRDEFHIIQKAMQSRLQYNAIKQHRTISFGVKSTRKQKKKKTEAENSDSRIK